MSVEHRAAVYVEVHDGVAEIVLNRPEKRNALNLEMWNQLSEAIEQCETQPEVHVVILRGSDLAAFSAGADISEFESVRRDSVANQRYSAVVKRAVMKLSTLEKPTIAMIGGYCVGGGTEIAVACDLRFATDTTKIGITPARLGFVYDVAETKMLVDLVGPSRAKDMLFSARLLDAKEAYDIGLIDKVFPEDQIIQETWNYVERLLNNAPNSIRGAKAIINGIMCGRSVDDPELQQIVSDSLDSPEYREGVRAFVEKRKPEFLKCQSRDRRK